MQLIRNKTLKKCYKTILNDITYFIFLQFLNSYILIAKYIVSFLMQNHCLLFLNIIFI